MSETNKDVAAQPAPNLRSVNQPPVSLSDQWTKLEVIERELRDRVRRDRNTILAEHDRVWVDIQNDYAQRISEEVSRLEKMRDGDLKDLTEKTAEKLREHELLAKRMGNIS